MLIYAYLIERYSCICVLKNECHTALLQFMYRELFDRRAAVHTQIYEQLLFLIIRLTHKGQQLIDNTLFSHYTQFSHYTLSSQRTCLPTIQCSPAHKHVLPLS